MKSIAYKKKSIVFGSSIILLSVGIKVDEIHDARVSKDKDPLIVEEGPMISSRAKKVKNSHVIICSSYSGWNTKHNKQNDRSHIEHRRRNKMDQQSSSKG